MGKVKVRNAHCLYACNSTNDAVTLPAGMKEHERKTAYLFVYNRPPCTIDEDCSRAHERQLCMSINIHGCT
eukprot:1142362-Pelagomonas_calceolata.AAC.6